jgi:hypothetical protein
MKKFYILIVSLVLGTMTTFAQSPYSAEYNRGIKDGENMAEYVLYTVAAIYVPPIESFNQATLHVPDANNPIETDVVNILATNPQFRIATVTYSSSIDYLAYERFAYEAAWQQGVINFYRESFSDWYWNGEISSDYYEGLKKGFNLRIKSRSIYL